MKTDSFKKATERVLHALKTDKKISVSSRMFKKLPNGKKLNMYVVTAKLLKDDRVIKFLADWRQKSNLWFPSQFNVTMDGTKNWASSQLLKKKDRILFFLQVEGEKEPFGHVGLYRFDYEKKSCEIDNVIRGENSESSKGGMTTGLQILIDWTFKYLNIDNLYLKVFSDNTKAIKLYERLEFSEVNRVPLFKTINNGVVSWIEDNSKKQDTDRYFVTMQYGKRA